MAFGGVEWAVVVPGPVTADPVEPALVRGDGLGAAVAVVVGRPVEGQYLAVPARGHPAVVLVQVHDDLLGGVPGEGGRAVGAEVPEGVDQSGVGAVLRAVDEEVEEALGHGAQ